MRVVAKGVKTIVLITQLYLDKIHFFFKNFEITSVGCPVQCQYPNVTGIA